MSKTIRNGIIITVLSALILAFGGWVWGTEGRVVKLEATADRLERIEDKIDKVINEQAQVRAELRRVIRPPVTAVAPSQPPRITERTAP